MEGENTIALYNYVFLMSSRCPRRYLFDSSRLQMSALCCSSDALTVLSCICVDAGTRREVEVQIGSLVCLSSNRSRFLRLAKDHPVQAADATRNAHY